MAAAQLFERARQDVGELEDAFAHGRFEGLLGWLRERVYQAGHRYSAARLIERATGFPPDHRPFLRTLRQKYADLYGI
jgi:carboxypeptidase Taq